MRTDLADDPAVIAVAAALDVDEDLVVGKLHRLWAWADRQSRDGHARGVTQKWIDRHLRCEGIAAALVDAGWLVLADDGVTIPNFERHNGETAKTRALGTKRKQKQRAECPDPVQNLSRSERDESGTREEKRREEPSSSDRSLDTPPAADTVGQFEGHAEPKPGINPAAPFAIALNRAGFRCTPLNPDLVAYVGEGGTVEHLLQCAAMPDCAGKAAAYPIRIARRELTEHAKPIAASDKRGAPVVAHNPGGVSPRLSPEEEAARQADALAEMERWKRDLGHAA